MDMQRWEELEDLLRRTLDNEVRVVSDEKIGHWKWLASDPNRSRAAKALATEISNSNLTGELGEEIALRFGEVIGSPLPEVEHDPLIDPSEFNQWKTAPLYMASGEPDFYYKLL